MVLAHLRVIHLGHKPQSGKNGSGLTSHCLVIQEKPKINRAHNHQHYYFNLWNISTQRPLLTMNESIFNGYQMITYSVWKFHIAHSIKYVIGGVNIRMHTFEPIYFTLYEVRSEVHLPYPVTFGRPWNQIATSRTLCRSSSIQFNPTFTGQVSARANPMFRIHSMICFPV